ncbi:MAG: hypothetical protein HY902_19670 [Deltaproteobacteria bacterium]|nr:hypothetical protein [Deltaproteobacteria bacterium]
MGKNSEQLQGVLLGTVGDWLQARGSALAPPLRFAYDGQALNLHREALAAAIPQLGPRLVLLLHGLMATDHGFAMGALAQADYGALLAEHKGLTPVRLRYNSGLPAAELGRDLAQALEQLHDEWPVQVEELVLVCHSMGGLVARAAWGEGLARQQQWIGKVTHIAYLGTPHLGAPLERAGRVLAAGLRASPDPVTQLVGRVADLRSLGIRQLGDATALPWPQGPRQLLVAGTLAAQSPLQGLLGDGMVSVRSALGDDPDHQRPADAETQVLTGVAHAQLAFSRKAADLLLAWLPDVPAAEAIENPAPPQGNSAPPLGATPRQVRADAVQLGLDAVQAGQRAVAEVRLGRADQVLAAVQTLAPGLAGPAQVAHAVHGQVVALQHGAIEVAVGAASAVTRAVRDRKG